MTPSEQILEFIDGTLESEREEVLFREMAERAELRSELREFISIGDAVRSDREAYAPPADVERALMASLGFGIIGSGSSAVAPATTVTTGFMALVKGFVPLVASFVVGGALAGGGVYLAMHGYAAEREQRTRAELSAHRSSGAPAAASLPQATELRSAPAPAAPAAATPEVSSSAATRRTHELRSSSGNAGVVGPDATTATPVDGLNGTVASALGTIAPVAVRESHESADLQIAAPSTDDAKATAAQQDVPVASALEGFSISPRLPNVSLEVRNLALTQPFVDNNARRVSPGIFDESALGLYYHLDPSSAIAIEAGRSRYTQVLITDMSRIDASSPAETYGRIEQAPNVAWFGLAMRRSFSDAFIAGLHPFLQGTLGYGLNNGPMVRGRAGASYDLLLGLRATGAVDASTLVYMYNGQPLITGKFGLSLGLELGF